jgi:hypothetical protein
MKPCVVTLVLAVLIGGGCTGKDEPLEAAGASKPDSNLNSPTTAVGTLQSPVEPEEIKSSNPSTEDRKITQAIRKSIVVEPGEEKHSVAARNIHISVKNGVVTLRGVVRSEKERSDIEGRAKSVAGVQQVENELEVQPR